MTNESLNVVDKKQVRFILNKPPTTQDKIKAIKCIRTFSDTGLKEAKDICDAVFNGDRVTTILPIFTNEALMKQSRPSRDYLIAELSTIGVSMSFVDDDQIKTIVDNLKELMTVAINTNHMCLAQDIFDVIKKHAG